MWWKSSISLLICPSASNNLSSTLLRISATMSFPQPTPTVISREHVDEVKEATSLTPMGKGNGDDNNLDDIAQILMDQEDIEYPAEGEYSPLL